MKLFASLIAAAAMTLTMLVATPIVANAAPYPGTVATKASYAVKGSVKRNRPVTAAYRVTARGNARPVGTVTVRIYKVVNGRFKFIKSISQRYVGSAIKRVSLGKFKKGKYATLMSFKPAKGSVYKASSSGVRKFRVR